MIFEVSSPKDLRLRLIAISGWLFNGLSATKETRNPSRQDSSAELKLGTVSQ
jgi:hypothetical protein